MAKPLRILLSKLKALFVRTRTPIWKIVIPASGLSSQNRVYYKGEEMMQVESVTVTIDVKSGLAKIDLKGVFCSGAVLVVDGEASWEVSSLQSITLKEKKS